MNVRDTITEKERKMIEVESKRESFGPMYDKFSIEKSIAEANFFFADKEENSGNLVYQPIDFLEPIKWNSKNKKIIIKIKETEAFSVMNWMERVYRNDDEFSINFKQKLEDTPSGYSKKWATLKFSKIKIENHECEISCNTAINMIHTIELSYLNCKLFYKINKEGMDTDWKNPSFQMICQSIVDNWNHPKTIKSL